MPNFIDLHIHSSATPDGMLNPRGLIKTALKNKLKVIALTDHNSVSNVEECIVYGKKSGVEVIPGIELSAELDGKEVHIIGLNIDYKSEFLKSYLDTINSIQYQRSIEIIKRLNQIGISIHYDLVSNLSNGCEVHTQHIAKALHRLGYGKSAKNAYEKFLAKDKVAFVKNNIPSAKDVAKIIKNCQGIPVRAHPRDIIENSNKKVIINKMEMIKAAGIEGIEVYFNHNGLNFAVETVLKNADKVGLLISGGSDYHGFENSKVKMGIVNGNVKVNDTLLEKMKLSSLWIRKDT